MEPYGGFIFVCENEKEATSLSSHIRREKSCSVSMDNDVLRFGEVEICFFSYDGKYINHAALMRRSTHVVTAKYRLKFFRFVDLSPTDIGEIEDPRFLPSPYLLLKPHMLQSSSDKETRMPAELWERLVTYVKTQRPKQADNIDELERLRQLSNQHFDSIGYQIIKQEKEATLLALKLFGADYEDIISYWVANPNEVAPYLVGLNKGYRGYEDNAIQHDILNSAKKIVPNAMLGDFESSVKGLYRIKKENGDTLSMINVNRTPIEKTTGADLVYYDHTYRSHVMIQYKMMTTEELKRENEKGKNGQKKERIEKKEDKVYHYSPDNKFYEQIERMRCILASVSDSKVGPTDTKEYRLDSNWFYFKLCEPYEFKPVSPDLADGIYLPLEYMEILLQSPQVQGKRSGIKITYENIGRYFPNSFFMKLVEEGLIGSYPSTSDKIYKQVQQSLTDDRSVTLAWKNI